MGILAAPLSLTPKVPNKYNLIPLFYHYWWDAVSLKSRYPVDMDNPPDFGITFDGPARYRIMVKGGVPEGWSNRMDGMSIRQTATDNEVLVTTLEGELADQAALTGVLDTLYELHLPIILVKQVDDSQIAVFDSRKTDKG